MYIVLKKKLIIKYAAFITLVVLIAGLFYFLKLQSTKKEAYKAPEESVNLPVQNSGQAVYVMGESSKIDSIKNDRDIIRSKTAQILTETLENPNASEEIKKDAENKLVVMAQNIDTEMKTESILKAKGFDEIVVFISDTVVTVTVGGGDLNQNDIYKIKDLVFEYSGNNNIKIVEVE